jgi:hypothetical protein
MESSDFSKTINGYKKVYVVTVISYTILLLLLGYLYITEKLKHEEKIYVISDSGRFIAKQTASDFMYDFDMKNQVRLFCEKMFAYDTQTFNKNVEEALNLIDDYGGKRIYNDLSKSGVYETLKKYNARTTITIVSVILDINKRPVSGVFYCTQTVQFSDQSTKLPIAAKFNLVSATRSEKNPFGMMITNFDYIKYDIGVTKLNTNSTPTENVEPQQTK